MRFIALSGSLLSVLAAIGCEPVADRSGPGDTITTPDATVTDSSVSDSTVPDAAVPDSGSNVTDTNDGAATDLYPNTSTDAPATSEPTEPDNTAKNARDADGDTKTPLDQGNSESDTQVTADIRQQVLDLEGASINARNVKIVTADGKVTLRGPVESAEERDQIEQIATKVAGEGNVDNQLEVKTE